MNKYIKSTLLVFLFLMILPACSAFPTTQAPDEISVRLKWLHGVQFAGLYIAEQKGFFAEENLSVTLEEGGIYLDEIELVAIGKNDFGVVGGGAIMDTRLAGAQIKAVATIFQIDPTVYFALAESGIKKPTDFIGKKVMVYPYDAKLQVILSKLGISMDQILAVPPNDDMSSFFRGEGDVWVGYVTNQVVKARQSGYEINVIYPEDYGVYEYGDCIIASEAMIEKNPDLVERFVRAAMRGWSYAIENPAEAAQISSQYTNAEDLTFLTASMEAQIPLIHNGAAHIGGMDPRIWQRMFDDLLDRESIPSDFLVEDVYTLQFLDAVYMKEK